MTKPMGIATLMNKYRGHYLRGLDYIKPYNFKAIPLDPADTYGDILPEDQSEKESRFSTMIDLLTRYLIFHDDAAFEGAKKSAEEQNQMAFYNRATQYLSEHRATFLAEKPTRQAYGYGYGLAELENYEKGHRRFANPLAAPSELACQHAQILLQRLSTFFAQHSSPEWLPSVCGFHVHNYDSSVVGEGDYLSDQVLYDMKTTINNPVEKTQYRGQLMLYYVYGQMNRGKDKKSGYPQFDTTKVLAFLDPRHNKMYGCLVDHVSEDARWKIEMCTVPR